MLKGLVESEPSIKSEYVFDVVSFYHSENEWSRTSAPTEILPVAAPTEILPVAAKKKKPFKELPQDALNIIVAFSKPHASLKLLNDATRVINPCYWKPLREALIGPFAGKVFTVLKTFMDNHVFMETSQRSLHAYEEFIGMPHLPYYGFLDIRQVWVPETDNTPVLTYEEKLQLVNEMFRYIQAQMDEDISFVILKINILADAKADDGGEDDEDGEDGEGGEYGEDGEGGEDDEDGEDEDGEDGEDEDGEDET